MHEQSGNKIVERLTVERSLEILGDETKMNIMEFMKTEGPSSFGDIIRELEISQQSGTNHILELELLGLIEKSVDPPNYNLNPDRFSILMKHKKE
jgi:DNA-binding HxlR family transcriptional regulator